jgi:hypothetical protein
VPFQSIDLIRGSLISIEILTYSSTDPFFAMPERERRHGTRPASFLLRCSID